MVKNGFANPFMDTQRRKKIAVGAHVWVYASKQPKSDVSPILEQPLRSPVFTKQIVEYIEKYKIGLIGTSYGAQMWDKTKHNEIYEDVDLVMTNLASVGGRTFGTSVGEPHGRLKTEAELDTQAELLKRLVKLGDAIIELAFEGGFKPIRPLKETLKMSRDYLRKTTGI
jgi:hypothetical protein